MTGRINGEGDREKRLERVTGRRDGEDDREKIGRGVREKKLRG